MENKLRQVQQQVLGKFQTLDHITATIKRIDDWVDGDNQKKDFPDRIIENTSKIETLETQMGSPADTDQMKVLLQSFHNRAIGEGDIDITTYMKQYWIDQDAVLALRNTYAAMSYRVGALETEIHESGNKVLERTLNSTIVVVTRLEQRLKAIENIYGRGSLKVVYNTGDIIPYPL